MRIPALHRKLLRDVSRLKGQVLTIALVLAGGIMSFVALRGAHASLVRSRDAYYDRQRFAHVFATVERAPETLAARIEALPGVEAVQTRISEPVSLPIEGMPRPALGLLLSLPPSGEPATNALRLERGRLPERERDDEVVVLRSFAEAHGLEPGHRVPVVVDGKLRRLRVVGTALSPEFVYALKPGALADDPAGFAILWTSRAPLAAAFQLDGAFNEVSLRLQPGASERSVRAALDRLLAPYGCDGAISRAHQRSNEILTSELEMLASLAGMMPMIFLGVAAFLVNVVLGRLVTLQRPEIATLKAVGYSDADVRRHYAGLVPVVLVPASALGVAGGYWLGGLLMELYGTVFRLPVMRFEPSLGVVAAAIAFSGAAGLSGALLAVRAAVRLPPAEAMRPPAPAVYHRTLLERLRLSSLAGPTGMMILRELERRPLRTLLSAVGIAGALALLVLGRFALDSVEAYLEGTLRREQRHDVAVTFDRPVSARAIGELAAVPGVWRVEGLRAVPARLRQGHRARDTAVVGIPRGATLRRVLERGGREVEVPADGILVTAKLAELLGVVVGDRPELELREGGRPVVRPVVAGLVDESIGLQVYARAELVSRLEGDGGAVSAALLTVDPLRLDGVEARLRALPRVLDVSELRAEVQRMRDQQASIEDVRTLVCVGLAAVVIFGVVYNNARIALATRARDLGSLRVLGFRSGDVAGILVGGMVAELALATPLGLWLGRSWARLVLAMADQEQFRWVAHVAPSTYVLATFVGVLAAAASALWVRRNVDRLDLVGVLKTRE
jgi:putative ABC transport system permease protein